VIRPPSSYEHAVVVSEWLSSERIRLHIHKLLTPQGPQCHWPSHLIFLLLQFVHALVTRRRFADGCSRSSMLVLTKQSVAGDRVEKCSDYTVSLPQNDVWRTSCLSLPSSYIILHPEFLKVSAGKPMLRLHSPGTPRRRRRHTQVSEHYAMVFQVADMKRPLRLHL